MSVLGIDGQMQLCKRTLDSSDVGIVVSSVPGLGVKCGYKIFGHRMGRRQFQCA